jgi:hypothetical protein
MLYPGRWWKLRQRNERAALGAAIAKRPGDVGKDAGGVVLSARKGSPWQVALARHLSESALAPNAWLATRLGMGTAKSVSSRTSMHRKTVSSDELIWKQLRMLECVD